MEEAARMRNREGVGTGGASLVRFGDLPTPTRRVPPPVDTLKAL